VVVVVVVFAAAQQVQVAAVAGVLARLAAHNPRTALLTLVVAVVQQANQYPHRRLLVTVVPVL
jgi:hypothetical protein